MNWPYALVDLTHDEKALRRELLDQYGVLAQLSTLIPVLAYQLYRLAVWVSSERKRAKTSYDAVPGSPNLKKRRLARSGVMASAWRKSLWWMGGELKRGWGKRGYWIAGTLWTAWLLFLCVHRTGIDYLHVTKRFGVIAASQLPVHYMLSMKTIYSPFALAFSSSHEQLNPYHRISGRIIYFLLFLHATFYMNFFVQAGVLILRLSSLVPLIGIVAFLMMTLLVTTTLESVRHWSYRVFFVLHLAIGVSILPLLFFHAKPLRLYVVESLIVFILDLFARKLDTLSAFTAITPVRDTNLLKLKIPIPISKIQRFKAAPGQHIYLSIPPESVPNMWDGPSIHDLLFNPFTVAEVSSTDITLVLRALNGPTTKALNKLTKLSKAKPPIKIEGPYGSSCRFPELASEFDRILLVAGGVGSTFILPIFQQLEASMANEGINSSKIKLIWSMRSVAEAHWFQSADNVPFSDQADNVKIYLTGKVDDTSEQPQDGSVEMEDLQRTNNDITVSGGHTRPDLREIVDETFRYGKEEKIAVLVCGPVGMAEELREHVGRWAFKGRYVWWHNEAFEW